MSTQKLSNVKLSDYREFLSKLSLCPNLSSKMPFEIYISQKKDFFDTLFNDK